MAVAEQVLGSEIVKKILNVALFMLTAPPSNLFFAFTAENLHNPESIDVNGPQNKPIVF